MLKWLFGKSETITEEALDKDEPDDGGETESDEVQNPPKQKKCQGPLQRKYAKKHHGRREYMYERRDDTSDSEDSSYSRPPERYVDCYDADDEYYGERRGFGWHDGYRGYRQESYRGYGRHSSYQGPYGGCSGYSGHNGGYNGGRGGYNRGRGGRHGGYGYC